MKNFVHLHTHSYYSLLDGVCSPEDLILSAKKSGMKTLALTDHNGLHGAIEFYEKAKEYNLKPLIGAEITLPDKTTLVLLVKDQTGYYNLCQIISIGKLEGGHLKFKCTLNDIKKYKQGLIALSGGHKGNISRLLKKREIDNAIAECKKLQNVFNEDFYLEMQHFSAQDTIVNLRLRDISAEHKIPIVATNDVHFVSSKEWNLRRVLHAIDENTVLEKIKTAGSSEQFLKSPSLMEDIFKAFPDALANTQKIARLCQFEFELGRPVFPSVDLPQGESSFSFLWKKCFEGATVRYQPLNQKVIQRLEYELKTIHELGFAEYFLIVKDIVEFCRKSHIPCVGRGSAADSLVSYVLSITQVDPIRHDLYFERFLNPQRKDPPDIDLDLCWKNRDKVIDYVYKKYGDDRTAMICTFNTFQSRSAIRDVAKTYGLPEDEINKITKYLPHQAIDRLEETLNSLPELREFRRNLPLYEEIMRVAQRIADFPRHLSVHPGGIIIAPDKITHYTPLEIAGKGIVISQFDMYSIEKLGLVKMDLLGVRSLSIITDCLKSIKRRSSDQPSAISHQQLVVREEQVDYTCHSSPDNTGRNPVSPPYQGGFRGMSPAADSTHPRTTENPLLKENRFQLSFDSAQESNTNNNAGAASSFNPPLTTPPRFDSAQQPEGNCSVPPLTFSDKSLNEKTKKNTNALFAHRSSPHDLSFLLKNAEELSPLDLRTIPEDDPQVTAYIRSGNTMACFQLESPAMRGLLKKMKIENVNDVIVAVALIRPGASGSGMKEVYIKRRAGLEKLEYVHPALAPALDDTYGVVIYQEQVLRVAHFVAGLSLGQADTLRRAMTKSRTKKEFMSIHTAFIEGSQKRGLTNSQAETVWAFLSQFVGYGFNKAHSATYGTIAYQTAFLKYYFPVEYMCAVFNNHGGFYGRMAYIEEARRLGIPLLPPDINYSNKEFTCEDNAIRTGLEPVFELTERTIKQIVEQRNARPFSDLFDFLRRTRAGEKETVHLIKCGAMQSLHPSAGQLLMLNKIFFKNNKKINVTEFVAKDTNIKPYNRYQKILNELEILDFSITAHPLALFEDKIDWERMTSSAQLEEHKGETVQVCGWLVTSRRVKTSKSQFMKFITLEDYDGLCEVVLFPEIYAQFGHIIRTHGPYIVTGKIQSRLPGEANLIAEKVELVQMNKQETEQVLQREAPALQMSHNHAEFAE
jgi:DNA polymerase III alpha subunit